MKDKEQFRGSKPNSKNDEQLSFLIQGNNLELPKLEKKTKLKKGGLELLYQIDDSGLFFDNRIKKNLIDVETIGKIFGVTPKTIHNWVYLRSIPYIKVGRKVMFRPKSLILWFNQKEIKP